MSINITVGFIGKEWEFYFGTGKYVLVELSGTILTAKVALSIKIA